MKKLLCCLLIALLLCGCGNSVQLEDIVLGNRNQNNNKIEETPALSEIGESKREESFLVLRFTINPDFELFVDESIFVTKVRCLNEDAQTLFADLDVLGLEYPVAVETILNAAKTKAFLTAETDKIQIQTSVVKPTDSGQEALEMLAADLAQPVEDFQTSNDLTFTVASETPTVENPTEESIANVTTGKPNSTDTQKVYDGRNWIGNLTSYYDENGILYQHVFEEFNECTSTYLYDTNGNITQEDSVYAEGHTRTILYGANRNRSEETFVSKDGTTTHITYRPDGTKSQEETIFSDGSSTTLYDADGNKTESTSLSDDGNSVHVLYRPDGTTISWEETLSDSTLTRLYNEKGLPITETRIFNDGRVSTTSFHPNGKQASIHEENANDGSSWDGVFDENGNYISEVLVHGDGYKAEFIYYPGTGIVQEIYTTDPAMGTYSEEYFAEDSMPTKRIVTWEGGTTETTFHANGQDAIVISSGNDHTSETHYDESGNRIYYYYNSGFSEYVIENDFFTYYIEDGKQVTDQAYLQKLYDNLKMAYGW